MFKVGDFVICVNADGCNQKKLEEGHVYKVKYVDKHILTIVEPSNDDIIGVFRADRFEFLSKRTKEDEKKEYNTFEPEYYKAGKFDTITYCQIHELGFEAFNAIKYCTRAGKKDKNKEVDDLKKAIKYIQRRIDFLEKGLNEDELV